MSSLWVGTTSQMKLYFITYSLLVITALLLSVWTNKNLLITNFTNYLWFYGGLTWVLLQKNTDPINETFPPGTKLPIKHNKSLVRGTINNIPLPVLLIIQSTASPPSNTSDDSSQLSDITESPTHVIILDSGITVKQSYDNLIKSGRDDVYPSISSNNSTTFDIIPHLIHHNSKVTIYHKGEFQKGYIHFSPEIGFQFAIWRNACSRNIYFTVPLPYFKQNCTTIVGNNILFYGHSTVSYFLKSSMTSNNDPSLNYVSSKNTLSPCPPSLFKDLRPSNPDFQVCLDSYNEEKQGFIEHEIYENILKNQYMELKLAGNAFHVTFNH